MSAVIKPWEKYQEPEAKPWEKYQQAEAPVQDALAQANKAIAEGMGAIPDLMHKATAPAYEAASKVWNHFPDKFKSYLDEKGIPTDKIWVPDPFKFSQSMMEKITSKGLKRGMEKIGARMPEGEPETAGEYIGQTVGEVSTWLLPITATAQRLSTGTRLVNKIADQVVRETVRHPFLAMSSEIGAGVGVGAARAFTEDEDPTTRGLAEMGAGVAGGMAPVGVAGVARRTMIPQGYIWGKNMLRKLTVPFTEEGVAHRASKFLRGKVADPDAARAAILDPDLQDLPPVVRAGERKLAGLYRDLLEKDPVADKDAIERLSNAIFNIENEMRGYGYGSMEVLTDVTKRRIASMELAMNKRILDATDRANQIIEKVPKAYRKSTESVVVKKELSRAYLAEQAKSREKWALVNKKIPVGTENLRAKYAEELADVAEAQMGDIPSILRASKLVGKIKEGETGDTTLREMQGLRSKLLEVARNARSGDKKNLNMARIADEASDAILEDMGIVARQAENPEALKLQEALAQTAYMKDRFQKGIVGKILGQDHTGAPRIDPEVILDKSIGRGGSQGAVDIDKVVVSPEAVKSTERWLGRSFAETATDKGRKPFDPKKAQKWMVENEEILDKFPQLKALMSDGEGAQQFANETQAAMNVRLKAIQSPTVSAASRYLNMPVDKVVPDILKSRKPFMTTRALMAQARKDPTGASEAGVKASFVEHILDTSRKGQPFDELGENVLSGRAMRAFIKKNQSVLKEVFSPDELSRMNKIANELTSMELLTRSTPEAAADVLQIEDFSSGLIKMLSRIGGAQVGRILARHTGGGTVQTPGIISGKFQELAGRFTKDRALQLINDAMLDPSGELLAALMLPLEKPNVPKAELSKNLRLLNDRMNAWLGSSGARVWEDIQRDIAEEQQ